MKITQDANLNEIKKMFLKSNECEKSLSLPFKKKCSCGYKGEMKPTCSEKGINNHLLFPPFKLLPHLESYSELYYGDNGSPL